MKRRTIELRSGTWEWSVVDPDETGRRARPWTRARATAATSAGDAALVGAATPEGAPPLPRRRIELRLSEDPRQCMTVRVPAHLGHAGDEAAVTMLAQNPDRRTVLDAEGQTWAVWPEDLEPNGPRPTLSGPRTVKAVRNGDRPRTLVLPDGLGLGQLTDRELLDLLG